MSDIFRGMRMYLLEGLGEQRLAIYRRIVQEHGGLPSTFSLSGSYFKL